MNQKLFKVASVTLAVLAVVILMLLKNGMAREDGRRLHLRLNKPDIVDQVRISVNNWGYEMQNNGVYMLDAIAGSSGGEFPRGSGHFIVYSGGFNLAAIKNGKKIVTNVQPSDGGTQMRPGALLNSGVPFLDLVADDPTSQDNRVYYITATHSEPNWPGPVTSAGAPALIAPGQTWAVFNDRDTTAELTRYEHAVGSGLGFEVQLESFAFDAGPAADAVYLKFTINNKTNVDYSGVQLGVYMDPDVENSSNDVVGCDTLLGLGYCYNVDNTDLGKCVGIDFLQGPIVNITDVDPYFQLKYATNTTVNVYNPDVNRYIPTVLPAGKMWLGATSFVTYANGTAPDDDSSTYNLMAGLEQDGSPKYGGGLHYRYSYPGDPVTQAAGATTNDPVQPLATFSDQRMMHGVGPFKILAGDKQEIWAAVVGGAGANRLAAITKMRAVDKDVQKAFDAGLVAPVAPPIPQIEVVGMDGKVLVKWKNNAEYAFDTYGRIAGITTANGYTANYDSTDFQGYRVYRSRTGVSGTFTQIAEFDQADGITLVTNRKISADGNLTIEEVHVGTDNGLRYSYEDNTVTNNQQYFYSVTAYDAQPYIASSGTLPFDAGTVNLPAGIPISLESSQGGNLVYVRPMASVSSVVLDAAMGDVTHTGPSDGSVNAEIIDPTKVQAGTYTVAFRTLPSVVGTKTLAGAAYLPANLVVYEVKLGTTVRTMESRLDDPRTFYDANANGTFDTGIDSLLDDSKFAFAQASASSEASEVPVIVDGIKIVVFGPALDFKAFNCTANAGGVLNPVAACAAPLSFNGMGFPTDDPDLINDQQVNGAFWFMTNASGVTTRTGFYDNYVENAVTFWNNGNPAGQRGFDVLVPYDFEIRWTATGQTGQINGAATQRAMPFEVWNATTGSQLLVTTLDDNASGSFDLIQSDSPISGGDNDPETDRYYIWNSKDPSAGSAGYNTWKALNDVVNSANGYIRVLGRQRLMSWNGGSISDPSWPANVVNPLPEVGTIYRVNTTKPNGLVDAFSFTATGNTAVAKSAQKKALKDIKVVPNPYYARTTWQRGLFDKQIKFTNLPAVCTIKIFTVSGDHVATIKHNDGSRNDRTNSVNPLSEGVLRGNALDASLAANQATSTETFDLRNQGLKLLASGMYIALVDAPGIGKQIVKFAIIQEALITNNPDPR